MMNDGNNQNNHMEILYDKKLICPLCGTGFSSKKIRSRFIKPEKLDTDFCQIFAPGDPNPLHYFVIICPECSYGFYDDSSRIPGNAREEVAVFLKEWRFSHPKSYCGKRSLYDVIETYRFALALADIVREIHINHAGLNIRLAWLFRGQQDGTNEQKYMTEALQHYEQSYINGDFAQTNVTEIQLLYLIGELHRRRQNYAEAIRYFGKVVHHEDKSRYRKYVSLARDQWQLAREEHMQKNNGQTDLQELTES
ncbi:MAG: DUF2225 domain-containing protein [Gracilibacteraceae bacterium]|jgi:uncharacterized protein (DUF2225 family)|nr:DUF2225 domain-containing protein [Gracilibacteraceae bacterium]